MSLKREIWIPSVFYSSRIGEPVRPLFWVASDQQMWSERKRPEMKRVVRFIKSCACYRVHSWSICASSTVWQQQHQQLLHTHLLAVWATDLWSVSKHIIFFSSYAGESKEGKRECVWKIDGGKKCQIKEKIVGASKIGKKELILCFISAIMSLYIKPFFYASIFLYRYIFVVVALLLSRATSNRPLSCDRKYCLGPKQNVCMCVCVCVVCMEVPHIPYIPQKHIFRLFSLTLHFRPNFPIPSVVYWEWMQTQIGHI